MKPTELSYKRVGCCAEYLNALVDLGDGVQAIVTDNQNGTFTVVKVRDGLMIAGSAKTITADDEV